MFNPQPQRLSLFKRPRVLIVGCGDVGLRVARQLAHCRVRALTSQVTRVPVLRELGATVVVSIWGRSVADYAAAAARLAAGG